MKGDAAVPIVASYLPEDKAACLALFDANCPEFFAPNERSDYSAYLASDGRHYQVVRLKDRVVGAFGVARTGEKQAGLAWIMIHPKAQRRGIGRAIMGEARALGRTLGADSLSIAASHKSAPFFARFGAVELGFVENGWGPGMHRVDMTWSLAL